MIVLEDAVPRFTLRGEYFAKIDNDFVVIEENRFILQRWNRVRKQIEEGT